MTPRLKTSIWVDAFLRQAMVDGHFGAVIHKGAEEAGAVILVINRMDGGHDVLEPPSGPAYADDGTRQFRKVNAEPMPWPDVSERVAKLRKRDPDLWVVEVEARTGFAGAKVIVE